MRRELNWARPPEEPATDTAWSLLGSPARGDALGGVGQLGRKTLSRLQNRQMVAGFLPLCHCRAPQHTRTHTLLWLAMATNFVRLESLGTGCSPFPTFLLAGPLFLEQDRRAFWASERTVWESLGLAWLGPYPLTTRQAAGHPKHCTAEGCWCPRPGLVGPLARGPAAAGTGHSWGR